LSPESTLCFFTTNMRFAMKIKNPRLTFACLIAFSILTIPLSGFAKDSALQVKCVDSAGNPVPNVKVEAFNLNTQKAKDKKSDDQGNAEFTKLDDGVYRVLGRKDGFAPALFEYAMLKESTESVTLKFSPGADKKFYFEDPLEEQKAIDLQRQGFEAYKQNKFADAEKLFNESLEISPSNPDTLYFCGVSCLQQSKFDQGVEMLKKAATISDALKTLPSQPASSSNHFEQIHQNVEMLLKRMPAIKGESLLKQRKYDEAIAQYTEAVKSDPGNAEYYANLAIALTNAKRFDEALTAIDKAIQLKPDEKGYATVKSSIAARKENAQIDKAQAILDEGKKLLQDGDAAGAIKKFEEAKSMVPEDRQSPLWTQIGKAQAKLNQPEAAVASFRKSIELAPADKVAEYRNTLAQYYLDNKQYEDAVDVLADPKIAGSTNPEQVLLDLAKKTKDRDPKLAETALERVLKTNPDNADVCFELGQMYYADGKEKDNRTKELLTKYVEIGKDPGKIENAKGMLMLVNKRSK
jgi:tetratricopeptide (TPR) repeat protein